MFCAFWCVQVIHIFYQIYSQIFHILDAVVKGVIFKLSTSSSSLLVFTDIADFYVLILYPTTLLTSLISLSNFFGGSIGFVIQASNQQTITHGPNLAFNLSFSNKVLLAQNHAYSLICCLQLLSCYSGRVQQLQQRCMTHTDLTALTLTEKVCQP